MHAKKTFSIIIFILAGIVLAIGITQIALLLGPYITMLSEARTLQGATNAQINEYILQQLLPQVLTYVVVSFGATAILVACGLISLQISNGFGRASSGADGSVDVAVAKPAAAPVAAPSASSAAAPSASQAAKPAAKPAAAKPAAKPAASRPARATAATKTATKTAAASAATKATGAAKTA
ncbi:MAG: hypothetical protein LBB35_01610, partial [Coriobacteriaceae bacterium]|nr:hypothetical protein [Coriobacteriaceae bacterium]